MLSYFHSPRGRRAGCRLKGTRNKSTSDSIENKWSSWKRICYPWIKPFIIGDRWSRIFITYFLGNRWSVQYSGQSWWHWSSALHSLSRLLCSSVWKLCASVDIGFFFQTTNLVLQKVSCKNTKHRIYCKNNASV